ncbi:MAG: hypothetical protein ACJAX3_002275 [Patiriisocius sp.]|jgi:hypothetical protein
MKKITFMAAFFISAFSIAQTITVASTNFERNTVVEIVSQLEITEVFPGQGGADLTADWFEIKNNGTVAWVSGTDGDLFYDDDSADPTAADPITGLTNIAPGATAIVLVTNDMAEVTTFTTIWGAVIDLTGVEIGMTDGSGLGGGGDAVTLWIGDPNTTMPVNIGAYPDTDANDGQSYDVSLAAFSVVGNTNGAVQTIATAGASGTVPNIGSPGDGMAVVNINPVVNMINPFFGVSEDGGEVTVGISISESSAVTASIDITMLAVGTAVEGQDFNYATTNTVIFPANDGTEKTFPIPIIDNMNDNSDVFFVVQLSNPVNVEIGTNDLFSVYILDDDTVIPAGDATQLDVNYLNSYLVDGDGTAEIVAYDPENQQLFVVNAAIINVLDFSDPANITELDFADVSDVGASAQSVAVNNGIVAIAISNNDETGNGFIAFSDTLGNETPVVVEVGVLPDMITFTPDGTKLLVANEGQPNTDYSIDPEGSVAIIDVTGGLADINQSDVTIVNFNAFDGQEAILNANGIRVYGPGSTASQDFEPEYIAVSGDSQTAYVCLQENNAYAIIDIANAQVTDVISFGLKDHALQQNSIDVSDETDFVFNANWPIKGMYMPDAISLYNVNGTDYIVTANEGDSREYDAFDEEVKIDDVDYILDPAVFSDIAILELDTNLSQINISAASGDADGDGLYEEIHVFGGRSFSIFEAATGTLVYDSANDFEVITAADPVYGAIFNASNSNNNPKNRSDNKGPEPEGVLVKEIADQFYAFVLLERIGGVMVYNITDPVNPVFLQYLNSREVTPGGDEMGDLGPEGLAYVSETESPTGTAYIVVANEVSATLSVYSLDNVVLGINENTGADTSFKLFPNPANGMVFLNIPGNYKVFSMLGREVINAENAASINISGLITGTYIVKNENGTAQKLLVK